MEKFEVGDKVKLVRLDVKDRLYVSSMNKFLGETMTVTRCEQCRDHLDIQLKESTLWFNPEWFELVEKKRKGWTGQVVCTSTTYPFFDFFTPGKVYDVKYGYLIDKTGTPYMPLQFNSANDLINYFETNTNYRFIEFKGFNGK